MAGERRVGFQPNIYDDESELLKQVWFDGEHGDAWSPSAHFRAVLGYILGDMRSNEIIINDKLLERIQHTPCHPGFLPRLWPRRRRYLSRLPSNQFRHGSCSQILDTRDPGQPDDELFMLTKI